MSTLILFNIHYYRFSCFTCSVLFLVKNDRCIVQVGCRVGRRRGKDSRHQLLTSTRFHVSVKILIVGKLLFLVLSSLRFSFFKLLTLLHFARLHVEKIVEITSTQFLTETISRFDLKLHDLLDDVLIEAFGGDFGVVGQFYCEIFRNDDFVYKKK